MHLHDRADTLASYINKTEGNKTTSFASIVTYIPSCNRNPSNCYPLFPTMC